MESLHVNLDNNGVLDPFFIDLSLRRSPEDVRDWKASTIYPPAQATPPTLDLRPFLQPIRSQGQQGACTAFSACAMKEFHEYRENKLAAYMSCQYLYNLRPTYPRFGMYLRDAMKILQKHGVCREKTFPYRESITNTVTDAASSEAQNFRVTHYAQVDTIADLKKALCKNGPCIIAFPIYTYKTEFWKQGLHGGFQKGGHAVAVVGYDETSFILRNSWGKGWGTGGYTNYKFTDWGSHWEVWTSIDANSEILTDAVYEVDSHDKKSSKDKKDNEKKSVCACMVC